MNNMNKQEPSIGRIVHYVLPALSGRAGQHRPAIITQVWNPIEHPSHPGMSNLTVFTAQAGDFPQAPETAAFRIGSVSFNADGAPGTWHWPERA